MDEHAKLEALAELAASLGIEVRRLPGAGQSSEHPGGSFVRLKGKEVLFLDPLSSPTDQCAVAAVALRGREGLVHRFLPPEIRQILDNAE